MYINISFYFFTLLQFDVRPVSWYRFLFICYVFWLESEQTVCPKRNKKKKIFIFESNFRINNQNIYLSFGAFTRGARVT